MKKHGRLFCALLLSILLIGALAVGCGETSLESSGTSVTSGTSTESEISTGASSASDEDGSDEASSDSSSSSEEEDDGVNGGTWTGEVPLS